MNMNRLIYTTWLSCVALCLCLVLGSTAIAQEGAAPVESQPTPSAEDSTGFAPSEQLALEQQQLAAKYQRFEEVLLRVAELAVSEDPERAALLRRTVAQSKEDMIGVQLDEIIDLLKTNSLAKAVKNQESLQSDLAMLLELLLSEDRNKKLDEQKEQVKEWIKQVNKLIKQQRAVQGSTESGGATQRNAELQAKLAEQTGELSEEMKATDEEAEQSEGDHAEGETEGTGSEEKPTPVSGESSDENSPGEGKPGEKGSEGEPSEGESSESSGAESSESEAEPGKGSPSPGQSGGQPSPGGESPGESQESQPSDPVQQRLEAAKQRMTEAEKRLEEALREEAVEEQEAALRELEQAKAELEKILRQLREEEIKRMLGMLEARFRKMLDLQLVIYEDTLRLDNVPKEQWQRDEEIQAGRLSSRESELVLDAEKALAILSDDGTAVALPEAIDQMREDMQQVATRLAQNKVSEVTQAIEEDIIAALEEIIAALEKAQADLESQQQQQQQQQGQPSDPPLVDRLAELKMIRALQMRVNRRTTRFSELIEGEQALQPDLIEALRELSDRELRIYRVLRDIVVGRTEGS